MSRFLLACWSFVGHINPYMSLALALKQRGHEVAIYTGEGLRDAVEGEGVALFPFRHVDEGRVWEIVRDVETAAPVGRRSLRAARRAARAWFAGTIPGQVADLEPMIAAWRPDALVAETAMWGPFLVLWEKLGIPVAIQSTLLGCLVPGRDAPIAPAPPPHGTGRRLLSQVLGLGIDLLALGLRREVDRIRGRHGLTPLGCSVNAFTGRLPLYLIPSVRELDYNRRDLPPSVHYLGPYTWDRPSRAAPPAWLNDMPRGRPLVHVTEGTVHSQQPFVLRAAMQGLGNQPMDVIMTTGPQRDTSPLELGAAAPNVRVERFVSHGDLLPRCSALVTTGGAGTVMAALRAGVPMVVVPTHWDKPANAQRVEEAGAGIRLAPGRCTPGRLRDAVVRVLEEPSYRANARRLARRLADATGPPGAAKLLESLVSSPVAVAQ